MSSRFRSPVEKKKRPKKIPNPCPPNPSRLQLAAHACGGYMIELPVKGPRGRGCGSDVVTEHVNTTPFPSVKCGEEVLGKFYYCIHCQ